MKTIRFFSLIILGVVLKIQAADIFYNGVGQLRSWSNAKNCTTFLIDMGSSPNAKAYALTNGHCEWEATVKKDMKDVKSDQNLLFYPIPLDSEGRAKYTASVKVKVQRVVWASVWGTDVAILELAVNNSFFIEYKIERYKIAQTYAPVGAEVERVDILHDALRISPGSLQGYVPVLREEQKIQYDAIKYSCFSEPGTSGSPVFDHLTREVVGIHNTRGKNNDCSAFACEERATGSLVSIYDQRYGMKIDFLHLCFDQVAEKFNFDLPQCQDHISKLQARRF